MNKPLFRTSLLGAVLMVLNGLHGCSSPKGPTATTNPSESKRLQVALIMKSLANEFFSTMAEGAQRHQLEHGGYDLIVNGIKDERDLSRQVGLVEEMVAAKVDAIVIAPADSKALVPALRRAMQAGIVVINIDNRLDAEILQAEQVRIPFVGPDNRKGAQKVGEHLAKQLSTGDQVVILEGIRTSFNAQQRLLGFQDAMQQAQIEIVDSQSAEWEMSTANVLAASMLSEYPKIKAILAANDSMALGAMAAAKSAAKEQQVTIVGFDNIQAVQQAIREGRILATADQYGNQLAVFGIEAALELLNSRKVTTENTTLSSNTAPNSSAVDMSDVETPVDLVTFESLTNSQ